MKNIFLIPTDKPSPNILLKDDDGTMTLFNQRFYDMWLFHQQFGDFAPSNATYQHIYITSDEEIKEGDWCIYKTGEIIQYLVKLNTDNLKKIILTTDPSLAPDVQKINDEFLEWFVKNPACEFVRVECSGRNCIEEFGCTKEVCNRVKSLKIIIPQKEPKDIIYYCEQGEPTCMYPKCVCNTSRLKEEPKQEIIDKVRNEEISEDYYPPKDLANVIWGTCFLYEDIEKNNIKEKIKNACFTIEKIYKIQELCKT